LPYSKYEHSLSRLNHLNSSINSLLYISLYLNTNLQAILDAIMDLLLFQNVNMNLSHLFIINLKHPNRFFILDLLKPSKTINESPLKFHLLTSHLIHSKVNELSIHLYTLLSSTCRFLISYDAYTQLILSFTPSHFIRYLPYIHLIRFSPDLLTILCMEWLLQSLVTPPSISLLFHQLVTLYLLVFLLFMMSFS